MIPVLRERSNSANSGIEVIPKETIQDFKEAGFKYFNQKYGGYELDPHTLFQRSRLEYARRQGSMLCLMLLNPSIPAGLYDNKAQKEVYGDDPIWSLRLMLH